MRPRENYSHFVAVGLGLTLAVLGTFQLYMLREPARIQADEANDQDAAVAAGRDLYASNCTACHGQNGEGLVGPALNSRELLKMAPDETLFSLIRTGVPGTVMPAWGQAFGGPFTDEQVDQLVAFIRAWEPTAPQTTAAAETAGPARGATIFASTCFICHGKNGQGTDRAPALNDPQRLNQFDDDWFRDTIARGRPAQGMPTWGTVLSPAQIDDLVALLAAWREGQTISLPIPQAVHLNDALLALQRSDPLDAVSHLNTALDQVEGPQAEGIQAVLDLIQENDLAGAAGQLQGLSGVAAGVSEESTGSVEEGETLFAANCAPCHAADGTGAIGPDLHANSFTQSLSDSDLMAFLLSGREGTPMAGFQGRLAEEQLSHIVALLRTWQE